MPKLDTTVIPATPDAQFEYFVLLFPLIVGVFLVTVAWLLLKRSNKK